MWISPGAGERAGLYNGQMFSNMDLFLSALFLLFFANAFLLPPCSSSGTSCFSSNLLSPLTYDLSCSDGFP